MKLKTTAALLTLCLTVAASAQQVKVFLNNKAFTGKTSGSPSDLMIEADTAMTVLGLNVTLAPGATDVELDSDKIAITWVGTTPMLRAKDLTQHFGGKYQFERDLGAVDIYAYDPVQAARKALTTVLKLRRVVNESDFDVLVLLTRQILTRDLGLTLDNDARVVFATPDEISKAAGREASTFVRYAKERNGGGTAEYSFMLAKGGPPIRIIDGLAWSWGFTWANLQMQNKSNDTHIAEGFANWTGYKCLERLVGSTITPREYKRKIKEDPVSREFDELVEVDRLGGVEAVLKSIKDQGRR